MTFIIHYYLIIITIIIMNHNLNYQPRKLHLVVEAVLSIEWEVILRFYQRLSRNSPILLKEHSENVLRKHIVLYISVLDMEISICKAP